MGINVDAELFYGITIYSADSGEPSEWPEGICRDEDDEPDPECEPSIDALEEWLKENGHQGVKVGGWGHVLQQSVFLYTAKHHAWDSHAKSISLSELSGHDTDEARARLIKALEGLGFSVGGEDSPEATFQLENIGWWLVAYSDYG